MGTGIQSVFYSIFGGFEVLQNGGLYENLENDWAVLYSKGVIHTASQYYAKRTKWPKTSKSDEPLSFGLP